MNAPTCPLGPLAPHAGLSNANLLQTLSCRVIDLFVDGELPHMNPRTTR